MKQVRNTTQRRLVLDAALRLMHPSADEVYDDVRAVDPRISRGTVYRNLNFLCETGELRRLSMPVGPDIFDKRTDNHYHFVCRRCGRVEDAALKYDSAFDSACVGIEGYVTEWHRLVLVGLCADCAADK